MSHRSDNIGIYIHIPFCRSKCYYRDFNSYAGREHLAGSYFDALFREITARSGHLGDRRVCSIFIGGGTPSLVDPGYITKLIDICRSHFHVEDDTEITMESNPGTLTYDKLQAYRDAGVNRLSIGLQAWQDRILKTIGRIHSRKQFVDNVEAAVKCGFDNINAYLIFGLPGQTIENWTETLEAVSGFSAIKHISCYSLKIEEGTVLGDKLMPDASAVDDELDRRCTIEPQTCWRRKATGGMRYRISQYPGLNAGILCCTGRRGNMPVSGREPIHTLTLRVLAM